MPSIGMVFLGTATAAPLVDDFLRAADSGECIETATYRMLKDTDGANPGAVVAAALEALARREQAQRAMGCDGDIGAQAIAAGADPEAVLPATAAGL